MTMLAVRGLTRRFGGLTAVDDVSFELAAGEVVGIIGPNGAGKSSLFSLITGFLVPDSGEVWFDGRNITGLKPYRIARAGLARGFQIVEVFSGMTVEDAIITAALSHLNIREARKAACQVMEDVGLSGKADALPEEMSIQDRKMLEVAKCLALRPKLILLDEVMAGLTLAEAQRPLALIERARQQGIAVLMVEHVMPVVMQATSRLIVMNFGKKIAEGEPTRVIEDPQVIDAYFGQPELA